MFKTFAAAGLLFLVGTVVAGANPAAPQIANPPANEWRGVAYLTSVTGCPASGYATGNLLRFRFSPASLGSNDGKSRLSFFSDYFAISYVATGSYFASSPVTASSGYTGAGTTGTATNVPKVRLFLDAPASLTTTGSYVALHGTITNFYDTSGCTMSFRGTGAKRP